MCAIQCKVMMKQRHSICVILVSRSKNEAVSKPRPVHPPARKRGLVVLVCHGTRPSLLVTFCKACAGLLDFAFTELMP